CGTRSTSPRQWVSTHPRDLPVGGRGVLLRWRKRRWRCQQPDCSTGSFTEQVVAVPARARLTTRLRGAAGAAVADGARTVVQTGRDLGLSWPTVMDAVTAYAAAVLPEQPEPVQVLGMDETRRGRPRFRVNAESGEWEMIVDRWHVGFVDIGGGQGLLGQVEGRTAAAVTDWLAQRGPQWHDQVRYVAIDMCTVFASAITAGLPKATIVVDHFHIVQLANKTVDEVRCRVTTQLRGRRGRNGDGEWEVRNLLTRNQENLSPRRYARMWNTLIDLGPPGKEILTPGSPRKSCATCSLWRVTARTATASASGCSPSTTGAPAPASPRSNASLPRSNAGGRISKRSSTPGSPTPPAKGSTAWSNSSPATHSGSPTQSTNAYPYAAPPPAAPADTSSPLKFEEPSLDAAAPVGQVTPFVCLTDPRVPIGGRQTIA